MSYPPSRQLPQHLRGGSNTTGPSATARPSTSLSATTTSTAGTSSRPSPQLQARVEAKRKELADLRDLRDLSGHLAAQMTQLEQKLGTLATGTEAVALILANWHSVLGAISMAASKIPAAADVAQDGGSEPTTDYPLPETLVRIPVRQPPASETGAAASGVADGTESSSRGVGV